MWIVWENQNNEYWHFDNKEEAIKHYEEVKDWISGEEMDGSEQVFLFKAVKRSYLVEDTDIEEDPKEYGYNGWVKWREEELFA